MAKPLVPNRPARLSTVRKMSAGEDRELPNAMKVTVCIGGGVVVNDDVNSLHINTAAKYISRNKDSLLKVFELLISRNPI
jgi:hypothetical protein